MHNPDGSIAFQTRDAILSLRNKEVVYDALNMPMASLHKKSISMVGVVASNRCSVCDSGYCRLPAAVSLLWETRYPLLG